MNLFFFFFLGEQEKLSVVVFKRPNVTFMRLLLNAKHHSQGLVSINSSNLSNSLTGKALLP